MFLYLFWKGELFSYIVHISSTFFLKELIVIIMKEKNIVLQYEILHIYNDRYEFEKTHAPKC